MNRRRRDPALSSEALDLFGYEDVVLAPADPVHAHAADGALPDESPARARGRRTRSSRLAAARTIDLSPRAMTPYGGALIPGGYAPSELVVAEPRDAALDDIPGASPASAVSVGVLTATAKDVLEGAFVPLWVRGEVSDFKAHRNGHWYFSLRDGSAQVRCVVWSRDRRGFPAAPDDGMQVAALGQVTVYAARGDLQLSVKAMEAEGDGLWRKALDATLRSLDADGLLAESRKRPIPRFPRRIVMITSPDGAALHDVISVARRRSPDVEIVVVAAAVQGEGAPDSLCAALDRVARWVRSAGPDAMVDTVIIGRGGGAREDLWAFNDERVVRAVAACPVPVISAVGHEVDITLCDLVADLRAPTPSAAAEAAVPVRADIHAAVHALGMALTAAADRAAAGARHRLERSARAVAVHAQRTVERRRARLEQASARLDALSPLATLGRGYAVARTLDGETLASTRGFSSGMSFTLTLRDGRVNAVAESVERGNVARRRTTPVAPRGHDFRAADEGA